MQLGLFHHEGFTLGYESHGEGERVIVYLHGLLLDAELNRHLAEKWVEQGWRVVLLDLLGHGRSDKPIHATQHRFDRYALQVRALLDHLGVDKAVVGGISLGADVALQFATMCPERTAGLIIEMPVLEWATPAAALLFVPVLLASHFARPPFRWVSNVAASLPRSKFGPLNSVINLLSLPPESVAAVLHGILVGPVAPDIDARRRIAVPTLIIAHERDLLHPFDDASNLSKQIPGARFLQAHSLFELRLRPERLLPEIAAFLRTIHLRA